MDIIIIILLVVLISLICIFGVLAIGNGKNDRIEQLEKSINENLQGSVQIFRDTVSQNQKNIGDMQTAKFREMDIIIKDMYDTMDSRLERLNKSMGQMNSLAMGVDDLKKVLTNVKTRGILGEIQLGAILNEVLSSEQYEENIVTVPGSKNFVEFAIKLPGNNGESIYLPVDSKFPLDAYSSLQEAREFGDKAAIDFSLKEFLSRIKSFARDINRKYISPPHTTDFGIMFLPVEGMYLEAVNNGMVEKLQREYKVCIAGPSTFAAMLNSLQMGFRTLAVEKRSAEVWGILKDIQEEFNKFNEAIESAQQRINQVNSDLDRLIGVRTRTILKKLRSIEKD